MEWKQRDGPFVSVPLFSQQSEPETRERKQKDRPRELLITQHIWISQCFLPIRPFYIVPAVVEISIMYFYIGIAFNPGEIELVTAV